jgi:hypothetical protein
MKNNFRKIKVSFKSVLQDASETSMQLKINFFDFVHGAASHAVTQLLTASRRVTNWTQHTCKWLDDNFQYRLETAEK